MKKTLLSTILIVFGLTINAQITYVNINATGANNGTSWADAYTDLHSATYNTTSGEIWVAQGTYIPSKTFTGNIPANNRQKTFRIQYNVQVYGGFNGTETLLSQRNWRSNVTTLSANVGGGLFAYNVVRFDGNNSNASIDGFTISQGQAGGTTELYGGAIYLTNSASPNISNCKFLNNTANQSGGAIHGTGGSPQIHNCEFRSNGTSVYDGAAIYFSGTSNVNIDNCLFSNNYAARHGGSILLINSTNAKIYNNTFVSNTSGSGGTGNAIQVSNTTTTSATIKNCIFYNNGPNPYDVGYNGGATLNIENCLGSALSGTTMTNNLSGNPLFVDFSNGNFSLLCTSPAVNTGDATGLTIQSTDLNGDPRTLNTIDMGAYENQTTAISVSANKTVVCAGDYVILRGSCDNLGYTWSNGVTNNVAFYPTATQTYTCTGNGTASTATITIEVVSITNENVIGTANVCKGGSATIDLTNSSVGAQYYLRDNSNDYIIDGPVTGTGSTISFTTNQLYTTTTYNVIGTNNAQTVPAPDYAVDFDGIDDKIITGYALPTTSNFSLEAWIYPEATTFKRIITRYPGGSSNPSDLSFDTYSTTNNGRALRLYVSNGTIKEVSVNNALTLNTWNHVAATFNGGNVKLYVNGMQVASGNVSATSLPTSATTKVTIGEDFAQGSSSDYFNGRMDEIRIWNRTLSQTEIASNMNYCLSGNEDSLKLYYRMNEGSGNVITDLSGNGNTGTLSTSDATNHWTSSNISCGTTLAPANTLGYALDFDGTNDMVTTTFRMPATSTFTIEGWVFPLSTNYDRLFSNYSTPVNGAIIIDTYNAVNNGMGIRFNVYGTGNALFTIGAANVLTYGAWNHVACTFNNGVMTAYINGFEAATGTAPFTSIPQIATNLCFGEDYVPGAAEYLYGKLDEIRVWNKSLNQTEITTNMNNCLTGTETGLLAYYNFEEGSGNVVNDFTINQNNGVMQNMDAATDWVAGKFACDINCSLEMTQTITVNVTNINKTTSVVFDAITANQSGATYQWLDCNNAYAPISGETAQSFTPTVNGNYAVAVTLNSCTDTSACVNFNSVSIKSLGTEAFTLFPNPTSNNLTIKSTEVIEKVEVYNVLGTLVLSETKTSFSVAELPTGIYVLQIKTAKGTGTRRFMKD